MKISAVQLERASGMTPESAAAWITAVNEAGADCGLTTAARWAMWIAQCAHESGTFRKLAESGDYTPERLLQVFPKYFTFETAQALGRTSKHPADQKAIFNRVYGGRMGNRPFTDDGWTYRAGGLIGLTGRDMYAAAGEHLGLDLLEEPDLIRTNRRYAAKSSAFFWDTRNLNKYADVGDIVGATQAINGGQNGIADRRTRYTLALSGLGVSAADELQRILGGR